MFSVKRLVFFSDKEGINYKGLQQTLQWKRRLGVTGNFGRIEMQNFLEFNHYNGVI